MIEIGKMQELSIDRLTSVGAYLVDQDSKENKQDGILLPQKEIPDKSKVGDKITVFIYRDSHDRMIATVRKPKITLGEFSALRVVDITKVGAFLDWGLEKDLLLPYHEQITKVQKGKEYLVNLYVDKSDRLCATMKVYPLLKAESPYNEGDWVEGYIYQINPELGAFIAIDNLYHGMVLKKEMSLDIHCGDKISARVTEKRKDGKLVLSPNKKAYKEIPKDATQIIEKLKINGGELPFNDKTNPGIIAKEFNMSKSSFKRAVGKLMKERKITQTASGIKLLGK